ncbi:MAG TPA: Ig-like domain-containing protein [Terriglobia bacterium]|nr:Ig-like domain-containing protein [Terriglobia bacterium]
MRKLHWTAALFAVAAVYLSEFIFSLAQARPASTPHHAAAFRRDSSPAASPNEYSIRWVSAAAEARTATVQVTGFSTATLRALQRPAWKLADWKRVLAVYAEQGSSTAVPDLPPMLGSYRIRSGLVTFDPQFLLDPGVVYRAVFRPGQLPGAQRVEDAPIAAVFKLPTIRPVPTTVVQQVFPSSVSLPENLLKFYVHFSAPMSRGRIYEHIHLRDDAGKEIELPFLEIDEELWDPTMTRLTLFIDPGRIKRGVLPLEEIGPALETGKSYSLVIDSDWKDGAGNLLQAGFAKRFSVAAPDRDPPDPARWNIQAPQPGTHTPLVVTFPEPMDQALAQRVIQVTGDSGEALSGSVTLGDEERRWVFVPANPWRPGTYQLVVPTTLEDLAGNNIGKPFEVDLFEGVQRRVTTPTVNVPFEVR